MRDFDSIKKKEMGIIEDRVRHIYNRGYEDGYEDGHRTGKIDGVMNVKVDELSYERGFIDGLNDAWDALKWCANTPTKCVEDAIGYWETAIIVTRYTPQEVIQKIKEYEEKQKQDDEIKVGDEVICYGTNNRKVVLGIKSSPTIAHYYHYYCYSEESGMSTEDSNCMPTKTGRHFDQIAEVLKKMQEVE